MCRPLSPTASTVLGAIERAGACTLREVAGAAGLDYGRARTTVANLVRSGRLSYSTRQEPHSCRPVAVYQRVELERDSVPRAADWWADISDAWRH